MGDGMYIAGNLVDHLTLLIRCHCILLGKSVDITHFLVKGIHIVGGQLNVASAALRMLAALFHFFGPYVEHREHLIDTL